MGLGINSSVGIGRVYPNDWLARYDLTTSRLAAATLHPVIVARLSPELQLEAGLNGSHSHTIADTTYRFDRSITTPSGNEQTLPLSNHVVLSAPDWTFGANVGLLYRPTPTTQIGLDYRSSMSYMLNGTATLQGVGPSRMIASTTAANTAYIVPETVSWNLYQTVSPQLALTGEVAWQNWSTLSTPVTTLATASQGSGRTYRDTVRVGLGLIYEASPSWSVRSGVMYDPNPLIDSFSNNSLNDLGLDLDLRYHPNTQFSLSLGYSHQFSGDPLMTADDEVTQPQTDGEHWITFEATYRF